MTQEVATKTTVPPVLTPESMQACRQQCWLWVGQLTSIDGDVLRAWIRLLEQQDAVEAFKREIKKP